MRPGGGAGESEASQGAAVGGTTDVHKVQEYICYLLCLDVSIVAHHFLFHSVFCQHLYMSFIWVSNISSHFLSVWFSAASPE